MLAWLSANLVNLALILFLAALVTLILVGKRRARKVGKSPCGCESCAGCSACGSGVCPHAKS